MPTGCPFCGHGDGLVILETVIDGDPRSKERPRSSRSRNGKVRTFTPKSTLEAEEAFAWAVRAVAPRPVVPRLGVFGVRMGFHTKTLRTRDVDNMVKLVLDACNNLLWNDDKQVERIGAYVQRGDAHPRTVLEISHHPETHGDDDHEDV